MPKINSMSDDTISMSIAGTSNFHFSAIRPEKLGATEYTLVTIVIDETGSVAGFSDNILDMVKSIISACQKNSRAENLLVRLTAFNEQVREIHGFKALAEIDTNDYKPFSPAGCTALYDATYDGVGAMLTYGKALYANDLEVNGIVFIVTDGDDNRSSMGPLSIFKQMKDALTMETIKGIISVLIGINTSSTTNTKLEQFQKEGGLTNYIDLGDVTPQKLAKLANFVSQSVSSQSQSLNAGTSGSVQLTF